MRWLPLLGAILIGVTGVRSVGGQQSAVRFEIASVGDSTFSFMVGRHNWIERGGRGIAVDPRRRDALIARFVVIGIDSGQATALVTGQTTRVTTDHVALLVRPPITWVRHEKFWAGAVAGVLAGLVLGIVIAD